MTKSKRRKFIILPLLILLLLLSAIFFVATRYKLTHFNDAQIDEILFYYYNGLAAGQSGTFLEVIYDNLLFVGIVFFLLLLPIIDFYKNRIRIDIDLSMFGRKKKLQLNPSRVPLWFKIGYSLAVFGISTWLLLGSFGVFSYIRSLSQVSDIYEKNYVEPRSAKLQFPEKKRNLIYIYLESMENTVASEEHGGQAPKSIIPELENLALDPQNVSFSNKPSGLGGALPASNTTWTVAGMTAQSSGVPLKSNILGIDSNESSAGLNQFLPGTYSLGEILKNEGYNQTFVMGSEATFGGRDKLLVQHGGYQIIDLQEARDSGKVGKDYGVWWGYEDKKLFEFARNEATRLSQQDAPFNLQLLTVDTHFVDGYLDPTCPTPFEYKYDNVFACSSRQVGEFVKWVKEQPFGENTTIVISGDHLGMQTSYYDDLIITPDYQRTIYNTIVNPAMQPTRQFERLFTTMDMYPTTLAAIGVKIEGNRLGLGTNLFSDEPTLLEKFGSLDALNSELEKRSEFYEKWILRGEK